MLADTHWRKTLWVVMVLLFSPVIVCSGWTATLARTVADGQGPALRTGLLAVRLDVLDRVFPDRMPTATEDNDPISVPRGGTVSFQFATWSGDSGTCKMHVSPITGADGAQLDGVTQLYELVTVHAEANSYKGAQTSVSKRPPDSWLAELVREAPFDVAEVLVARSTVELEGKRTTGLLLDVTIGRKAKPGAYNGTLQLRHGQDSAQVGFSIRVHETALPTEGWLSTIYWLSVKPEDLTSEDPPAFWSEDHWRLVKRAGQALRAFGQDTIYTPIIDGKHPLIRTIRQKEKTYVFDYKGFDRWCEMFLRLGFRRFAGHHVGGGHKLRMPPMAHLGGVFVWDETTGKREVLFSKQDNVDDWLAFLGVFYKSLHRHLTKRGWAKHYVQCQMDEPHDIENYQKLASVARKHLPGIKTQDAINSNPEKYSPLVDIHVFSLTTLAKYQALAQDRLAKGQSVWVYHCCSPYPPYPNRHLDERLSNSRLYPWLAYLLKAEGYLFWAANRYRGADPYKTSIGPLPSGSQDPGHPLGDNWFFYPGKDGLRGSLRMVAFRDGLTDHKLLTMLAKRNPDMANRIMKQIARSIKDYQKDAASFHQARKRLLEILDQVVD